MARVLIVDDSFLARKKLKDILVKAGHSIVAEAANGLEAFYEYERSKPDLITMSIKMSKLSGIEAIEKILAVFPNAKILVISILDHKNLVFEALEKGAKHYIFKPITKEKIISVVNTVLGDQA